MLDQMEHDLSARPGQFADHWSLGAVQSYCSAWMDSPLPPALRVRLSTVADRLFATVPVLSVSSQSDGYYLAALLYRAASQTKRAAAACEEALRAPGDHESPRFLM